MHRKIAFLLSSLILLTSCAKPGDTTPGTAIPVSPPASTESPTSSTPLTILMLPADMPQAEYDRYQTLVYDLAQANGMRFQVRNTLTAADITFEGSALKIVIALPPDPGLEALAASAPGVQFLAVDIPGLAAAPNLSSVGASGLPVDQQAFVAGYIAGMVAPEWKVGILYPKNTNSGTTARDAFTNGFYFYCGTCRNPFFTYPVGIYPILVGISSDTPESDYNGHADILIHNLVKVAYVCPEVAQPEMLSYMAGSGVLLIGQTLPSEDIRPNWIASIQPDLISAVQRIFPELVAGNGGQIAPTSLFLTDVNTSLLSDAKIRLVQEVLDGLQNGTIGTGVNP